jgi:phosphatidylglycerophosphate synthase
MKSLSELRKFALDKKGNNESIYAYYFLRRISPVFTWIFLRIGISANTVTLFSLLLAILGSLFFISESVVFWILGWIFYQLYYILDCTDGEIAVLTETTSEWGAFLDRIAHPITNSAIVYFSAFGAYRITGNFYLLVFSAIGAMIFSLMVFLRLYKSNNASGGGSSTKNTPNKFQKLRGIAKDVILNPGAVTHPLPFLLAVDIVLGIHFRVIYPMLLTLVVFAGFVKRLLTLRNQL